jgi:hypothetical protein
MVPPPPTPEREAGGASCDTLTPSGIIEQYLDRLCAPLAGVLPPAERCRLREETGGHLESLARAYTHEGREPVEAARLAVEKFGECGAVGEDFLEAWFAHQPRGALAQRIGLANARALTCFGAANLTAALLLLVRVCWPSAEPYTFGLSVAQARQIVPEPLPLPDLSPASLALAVVALVGPPAAGWAAGTWVPVRPVRAVLRVQVLLTLYTFALGAQLLPLREGILLGVFQVVYWLPAGAGAAHLAAALTRRRRQRWHEAPTPAESGSGAAPAAMGAAP